MTFGRPLFALLVASTSAAAGVVFEHFRAGEPERASAARGPVSAPVRGCVDGAAREGARFVADPPLSEEAAEALLRATLTGGRLSERLELLGRIAREIDAGAVPAALGWSDELPPGTLRHQFRVWLLQRRAAVAPTAALAWVDAHARGGDRRRLTLEVVDVWLDHDADAAGQWIAAQPAGALREEALRAWVDVAAQREPGRALAIVAATCTKHEAMELVPNILQSWALIDGRAAAAHAESLPPGPARASSFALVAAAWGRSDPWAAVQWALALEPPAPRAIAAGIEALQVEDPRTAIDVARAHQSGAALRQQVAGTVRRWIADDPDGALEWLESLDDRGMRDPAIGAAIGELAVIDPARAASLLGALPRGGTKRQAVEAVAGEWMQVDPGAALQWLDGLGDDRATAVAVMARDWSTLNPDAAARTVAELPIGPTRHAAVIDVALGWAEQAPADASAWATSLGAGETRQEALRAIAGSWAGRDPEAAAAFAHGIEDDEERATVAAHVAAAWAEQEPVAAADWLLSELDDSASDGPAVTSIVDAWPLDDTAGLETWIEERLSGGERADLAWLATADLYRYQDPRAALDAAARLSNEAARRAELESILGDLFGAEPDLARDLAVTYDIPPAAIDGSYQVVDFGCDGPQGPHLVFGCGASGEYSLP